MDYISRDSFPSPPITPFHSPLPSSLEPFTENYRFCNWKSHHRKTYTETASVAPSSASASPLPPVEPH